MSVLEVKGYYCMLPPVRNEVDREEEYRTTLNREIRDYMRNGDPVMLRRFLFKMFVHHPTPATFQQQKANTVLMLMMHDSDMSSHIIVRQ